MIYCPRDVPVADPLPYGGTQPEFPYGRDSTAVVFSDEGGRFWGFFDSEWRGDDGSVRGQLRINIASRGHGGLGLDHQTQTYWADADDSVQIVDRIDSALRFAFDEGGRQERARIRSLLEP